MRDEHSGPIRFRLGALEAIIMSEISLASPSHTMPPTPSSRRPGLWLSLVLAGAVLIAGGSLFFLLRPSEPGALPPQIAASLEAASRPGAPSQPPLVLPGFQRRGPLLTGEVKTGDGSTLRLVIDSRSHAIVGYRIIEPPASQNR
jgi:hypothetical protein